jgi:multicomponent Na+:H+ antiporter subunit F
MLAAAILALLVTVALALVRAALGPTVFDRLQAANSIGTCAMLLLALLGFLGGRPGVSRSGAGLWPAQRDRRDSPC